MNKKSVFCLLMTVLACGFSAFGGDEELITINSVVATPRYPWNGIWDIVVDITMPENKSVNLEFEAKDSQTGKRLTCGAVQRSDGGPMLAANGKTRFVWFTDRDLGTGITEHVTVGVTPAPHMIIDVSGGPDATGYPVSIQYLLDVPAPTGWTDEYKTTKIVMRWIRPSVFDREGYTTVYPQINANYWIGVFETTQRQYEMVTGLKRGTHKGIMRPVESLSFEEVTNYVACLKRKTGRKFGLPDNATWEYACRAGSTSSCYDGTGSCARKAAFAGSGSSIDLGRYADNQDDGRGGFAEHTNVGSYVPNAYGLYDMLGNVSELASIVRAPHPYGPSSSSSDYIYVGGNLGDYRYEWDSSSRVARYYYVSTGSDYVYKQTPHSLGFHGGGYLDAASKLSAKNVAAGTSSTSTCSYRNLSFRTLDSQPTGFGGLGSLRGSKQDGFRLYCDAE